MTWAGLLICASLGNSEAANAQDPIEGQWFDEKGNARIEIYRAADNKFYGKVAWLREPLRNGRPKVDENNPDPKYRSQPILGMMVLSGFVKDGDEYEDGIVYDPKHGKRYSCKMKLEGDRLEVRGYMGISLVGRSTTWTRADSK